MNREYYSIEDTANMLGVSPASIRNARSRGGSLADLNFVRFGRSLKIVKADIDAWVETQRRRGRGIRAENMSE